MDTTDRRSLELEELRKLQQRIKQKDTLEEKIKACQERRQSLLRYAQTADASIPQKPTNHYEKLEKELNAKRFDACSRKESWVKLLIILVMIALGLAMIALSRAFDVDILATAQDWEIDVESNDVLHIAMPAAFTFIMIIFALAECDWSGESLGDWIFSFFGWVRIIGIGWGLISLAMNITMLMQISKVLAAIPILIIVLMFVYRHIRENGLNPRNYTSHEQDLLAEAKEKDKENSKRNAQAEAESIARKSASIQGQLAENDRQTTQLQSELSQLQSQINRNPYLRPNDHASIDSIVYYLETGRADSIKEALHYVDRDNEENRKRVLAEFERRNQEIQARFDRDRQAYQREVDRAIARNNREKLEEKLDDLEKDIKYYNKYGWDKA